jgi:hypothetical protein
MAEMVGRGEAKELTGLTVALSYHLGQARVLTDVAAAEDVDIQELRVRL